MAQYTLVIGNKAYSSWSLRPWLAMKYAGLAFDEVRIPLYQDGHAAKIRQYSRSGKVPVLVDGSTIVWESLAICEYLADRHAEWNDGLQRYGGPFLLGAFSVADAMYAPVVTRFKTYAVKLSDAAQRYADTVLALPAMQEWYAGAHAEVEVLPQYEHLG